MGQFYFKSLHAAETTGVLKLFCIFYTKGHLEFSEYVTDKNVLILKFKGSILKFLDISYFYLFMYETRFRRKSVSPRWRGRWSGSGAAALRGMGGGLRHGLERPPHPCGRQGCRWIPRRARQQRYIIIPCYTINFKPLAHFVN